MKRAFRLTYYTLTAALALSALSAATLADDVAPSYVVYDTGTLGGDEAFANGINNLGWVAGGLNTAAGAVHAAEWIPGTVIDLGTLGGTNSAVEWPIKNDHGLVVGISETATPDPLGESFSCSAFIATNGHTCLPFLWQNGELSALPLLGGNNGFATGINNAGVAVGWAETAVHDKTCVLPQQLQFEAAEWGPGTNTVRVLAPLAGDSSSAATALNDAGEAVGISGDCDVAVGAFSARHAVLWINGKPLKLPTLGGQGWNTPMAINNLGIIAGFSDTPGDVVNGVLNANFQATLWTPGGIVNLHTLPGDALAEATGINNFDQVVGTSFGPGGSRAFLWQHGQLYDLNTLVQPNAPLYLIATGDINDRGEITGVGCVVVAGACGTVAHTFLAIVGPRTADERMKDTGGSRERPRIGSALQQRLLRLTWFGHMQAEREPAH
jgi:probable HAF family extracellular repeat protein